MKHVIDTLTEYRDTYKELIDNEEVVTLPVYVEKYNQYSDALKNMEASSRIIHRRELLDFKDRWNDLPDEHDDKLYITSDTIDKYLKSNSG